MTTELSAANPTATLAPVVLPPVKATLATFGWVTSGSPTTAPYPVTTLTTPAGNPDSAITSFTNSSRDADVYSDGLMTTVHPAANAGASFQVVSISGEFHGVMKAQTPTGSRGMVPDAGMFDLVSSFTAFPALLMRALRSGVSGRK